jgi:hypothetical protein
MSKMQAATLLEQFPRLDLSMIQTLLSLKPDEIEAIASKVRSGEMSVPSIFPVEGEGGVIKGAVTVTDPESA